MKLSWIALVALLVTPLVAQDDAPVDPRERELLAAEIAELTDGDLDRAIAVYRKVRGDAEAPATLRHRASYALARSLRKRGALQEAETVLRALVAAKDVDPAIAKPAAAFLRELTAPAADTPFDWRTAMENDPALRERIVQLCLDLVNPSKRFETMLSLIAIGRIAAPTVEQFGRATGSLSHRLSLGVVLIRSGHFDALPWVLGTTTGKLVEHHAWDIFELGSWLLQQPDATRQAVLDAIRKVTVVPEAVWAAGLLRACCGDGRDAERWLVALDPLMETKNTLALRAMRPLLATLAERNDATRIAILDRLRKPMTVPVTTAYRYCFEILQERLHPGLSGSELVAALERGRSRNAWHPDDVEATVHGLFVRLLNDGDVATARALASSGDNSESISRRYVQPNPVPVPASFLPVLHEAPFGARWLWDRLRAHDFPTLVPAFIATLRDGKARTLMSTPFWPATGFVVTKTLFRAMPDVLAFDDPWARNFAAMSIAHHPDDQTEAIAKALAKTAVTDGAVSDDANAAANQVHHATASVALWALLRASGAHPEYATIAVDALGRVADEDATLHAVGSIPQAARGELLVTAIHAATTPSGLAAVRRLANGLSDPPLVNAVSPHRALFEDRRRREAFRWIGTHAFTPAEAWRPLFEATFRDEAFDDAVRVASFHHAWPASAAWVEWDAFLAKPDPCAWPIVGALTRVSSSRNGNRNGPVRPTGHASGRLLEWLFEQSLPRHQAILTALAASGDEKLRLIGIQLARQSGSDPAWTTALLGGALDDADHDVRLEAVDALASTRSAHALPHLLRILNDPALEPYRRLYARMVLDRLVEIASTETIPAVAALLEDPDLNVRAAAAAALRKIRQAITDRDEARRK